MLHFRVIYKPLTSPWTCLLTNINGHHQSCKLSGCWVNCYYYGNHVSDHRLPVLVDEYSQPAIPVHSLLYYVLGGPWADWLGFRPMSDHYNAHLEVYFSIWWSKMQVLAVLHHWMSWPVYLYDIVFSHTVNDHLNFSQLMKASLKVKCHLLQDNKNLSHVLSGKQAKSDPEKVRSVPDWPISTLTEIVPWIGLLLLLVYQRICANCCSTYVLTELAMVNFLWKAYSWS